MGVYSRVSVKSRLALPLDLSESAEKVCWIYEDFHLSNFHKSVLSLVENEQKVLMIVTESCDFVKMNLPQDSFIIHKWDQINEEEASQWINGTSKKKFLITDERKVIGFEFDTVIIVAHAQEKDYISSVCQRATARLIVCIFRQNYVSVLDSKQPKRRNWFFEMVTNLKKTFYGDLDRMGAVDAAAPSDFKESSF